MELFYVFTAPIASERGADAISCLRARQAAALCFFTPALGDASLCILVFIN